MKEKRTILLVVSLLLGSFLISLVALVLRPERSERVFFTFTHISGSPVTTERYIPRTRDPKDRMKLFLDELIAGPWFPELKEILPSHTEVKTVIVDGERCFIDFGGSLILNVKDPAELNEKFFQIGKIIRLNFPKLKVITLSIDGQLLSKPPLLVNQVSEISDKQ